MILKKYLNEILVFFKANRQLFGLVILIDLAFITLHCFLLWGIVDYDLNYSIEQDTGYAEMYQYIKEFGISLILLLLFYKRRQFIYLVLGIFFLCLLLDDSLSLHENYGAYLADYFNIKARFNLRAEDLGELLTFFFFGIPFFISIVFTFLKTDIKTKLITKNLFILMVILAFFSTCIDMLHVMLPYGKNKLAILEDGGEMFAMSLIFIYVFNVYHSGEKP